MFNIFKPKTQGDQVTFKIGGMHCVSCGMNIDGELEEAAGVISAATNYAQGRTVVVYDAAKINPKKLQKIIESLDYTATQSD
jgi:Cu+-exporting ATPase